MRGRHLEEKRLDILLRGCNEELGAVPLPVFAYGLAEEVKPLFDMRDDCFLRGELQSSLPHELLHQGLDFLFE